MPPARPSSQLLCRACRQIPPRTQQRCFASTASDAPDVYDVVCVGGGPAGLSLLASLRSSPITSSLRTALVEAQPLSNLRAVPGLETYSNRCSSLTPASAAHLRTIGAWKHLRIERVTPYREMQVWDGVSDARIEFEMPTVTGLGSSSTRDDPKTIAYMVENVNLTAALLQRLDELGGVEIYERARVEGIDTGADATAQGGPDLSTWPVVRLSSGKKLHARLLVGADGANSPVRAFADIGSSGWDYDRHGVVATLEHADDTSVEDAVGWQVDPRPYRGYTPDPVHKIAYQRFLPTGPAAMLPMPGRYSTLVWTTTPENAAVLKALSPTDFVAMVNAAFRLRPVDLRYMHTIPSGQANELAWRLQHTEFPCAPASIPRTVVDVHPGTVASFPLRMRHADSYTFHRVALVGDAAHTTHPLAGQGLNAGQADVASLARCVEGVVARGGDIGAILSLEPYARERYFANHVLLGVCDKLNWLYSVGSGPVVPLRSWGLQAVNAVGAVKGFLMRQAAGL